MVLFWIVVAAIVLFIIFAKKPDSGATPGKGKIGMTITSPNPDTDDAEAFYEFVKSTPAYKLEAWYPAAKKQGLKFKPEYEEAIKEKLKAEKLQEEATKKLVNSRRHNIPERYFKSYDDSEEGLMEELEDLMAEGDKSLVRAFMCDQKSMGVFLPDKVYARAMSFLDGRKWLSDEEFEEKQKSVNKKP